MTWLAHFGKSVESHSLPTGMSALLILIRKRGSAMTISKNVVRLFTCVCAFTLLLGVLAIPTLAQSNKADILGTVTDTSGAVVVGATVTITKVDTNATRPPITTGDNGEYLAPSLEIGTYKITVSKQGYQTATHENVVLQTNDRLRIDIALQPGTVTGEVTITAAAPLIKTESSDRGSVVTGREVTELPLSGRNFTQLATLTPGVAASNNTGFGGTGPDARQFNNGDPRAGDGGPGSSNSQGSTENSRFARSGSGALTVNGQRSTNNNFSLDGVDNNEPQFGTIGVFPNPDAIAEFKVTTSVPPAEVGRAAGAVINTSIKSGTNEFHGSGYYYGQNSALNAYHPRLKRDRADAISRGVTNLGPFTKAVQQIHEFGGTIGGPIFKNRTFFFFDYLGQRNHLPFPASSTVPTAGSRNGNFTGFPVKDCDGNSGTTADDGPVCNPFTGQAFANATIPGNLISPISQKIFNLFPLPTINVLNPENVVRGTPPSMAGFTGMPGT